ncbi:unnamed protein product [Soboliphyme baturini]|uniref:UBP-type domain-containing protein n=1 Tax=Soboliphyme baturini TaxID=241478 RepID=A0A183IK38_9BILA|nr:unnamed protein product [Soboliphyme baturini]
MVFLNATFEEKVILGLNKIDPDALCSLCSNIGENWTCLICYETFCGRYVNQHGIFHFATTHHALALSVTDFSVWCYACDSYVHNSKFEAARRILHVKKFGYEPFESS